MNSKDGVLLEMTFVLLMTFLGMGMVIAAFGH